MQEVTIFNKINKQYNYSQTEIARITELDRTLISRFLRAEQDISLSKFFKLIRAMPPSFQEAYWKEVLGYKNVKLTSERIPWTDLIEEADFDDLEEIFGAISARWTKLTESKKELTKV
jgi:transcriptional regulator with XRE-family HTH domain